MMTWQSAVISGGGVSDGAEGRLRLNCYVVVIHAACPSSQEGSNCMCRRVSYDV